jgi:hypothetical protein
VQPWPKGFKTAFCERFGCGEEQYADRAYRECLTPHGRLLWRIIHLLEREYFVPDRLLFEHLADATDWARFETELDSFIREDAMLGNALRRVLGIRVSVKRARLLGAMLAEEGADPPPEAGLP